jgi:hypothetical protein
MTIKVKLKQQAKIKTQTSLGEPTVPSRISATLFTNRLDSLNDVNAIGEISGATLVYNANTDVYSVERLNFEDIDGSMDGGEF